MSHKSEMAGPFIRGDTMINNYFHFTLHLRSVQDGRNVIDSEGFVHICNMFVILARPDDISSRSLAFPALNYG